jgi:hypothetical protein
MLCGMLSAAQPPPGWQTYSNPDYGFTISYPPDIKLYSARDGGPGGYSPICFETTVTCLGYSGTDYQGTNFEGAGVAINVLRDAKTEQDCDTLRSPFPTRVEIIHGHPFHTAIVTDAGLSHVTSGPAYRAFYQNVCFESANHSTRWSTPSASPVRSSEAPIGKSPATADAAAFSNTRLAIQSGCWLNTRMARKIRSESPAPAPSRIKGAITLSPPS